MVSKKNNNSYIKINKIIKDSQNRVQTFQKNVNNSLDRLENRLNKELDKEIDKILNNDLKAKF